MLRTVVAQLSWKHIVTSPYPLLPDSHPYYNVRVTYAVAPPYRTGSAQSTQIHIHITCLNGGLRIRSFSVARVRSWPKVDLCPHFRSRSALGSCALLPNGCTWPPHCPLATTAFGASCTGNWFAAVSHAQKPVLLLQLVVQRAILQLFLRSGELGKDANKANFGRIIVTRLRGRCTYCGCHASLFICHVQQRVVLCCAVL